MQGDYKEASRADRVLHADRADDGQCIRTNDEHLSSDSEGTKGSFVISVLDFDTNKKTCLIVSFLVVVICGN